MDWAEGLLHFKKSKSGHGRTLPLPADAGALLANYIRPERPVTDYREIFITSVGLRSIRSIRCGGFRHEFLFRQISFLMSGSEL